MANRELIVERIKYGLVKVYWSDNPHTNVWAGLEDEFRDVLELYRDADYAGRKLQTLFGYNIVYK